MSRMIFVGGRDFISIFKNFGMETSLLENQNEFENIISGLTKEYAVIFVSRVFSGSVSKFLDLHPELNIVLLSEEFDKNVVIKDFKSISEKAAGVDLTGKLEQQ